MHVKCPHCRAAVEVAEESNLADLQCPSCHADFSLPTEDTLDYAPPRVTEEEASLDIPSRIGHFDLIRQVGKKGKSEVWQAHDTQLNRLVILKFRSFAPADGATVQLCEREAVTAARLDHPNISKVYDTLVADNRLFIVSEYIEGIQLDKWAIRRTISPREGGAMCLQIARAIAHAHSRGVIHCDLKPSNIIVDEAGAPHIIDFGLAHFDDHASPDSSGLLLGTLSYMSPEQASVGINHFAPSVDIYAIGAILYELLTGRPPFLAGAPQLLKRILHEAPPAPSSLNPNVPRQLESICLRCLKKEPSSRYSTAEHLADDLESALSTIPVRTDTRTSEFSLHRRAQEQLTPLAVVLLAILAGMLLPATISFQRLVAGGVIATVFFAVVALYRIVRQRAMTSSHAEPADSVMLPPLPEGHQYRQLNVALRKQLQERQQMLVTMKTEYDLYRTLVEGLPLGVFRKDLGGRFVYANEHFSHAIARAPNGLIGKNARDIFGDELAAQQEANDAQVVTTDEVISSTEQHTADGRVVTHFEVVKSPVHNYQGKIVGVQGIMWDISAHTNLEKALRSAKDAAEIANRAKSDFLANISHEIRTPMTAIIGLAELLLGTELDATQREYLTMLHQSGNSLLWIINDVLDFSTIEAGKLQLVPSVFCLRQELDATLRTLDVSARAKHLILTHTIADDVPTTVFGDAVRLRQVLANLVSNSIKFTEHGSVEIRVTVRERLQDRLPLLFEVSDTGMGIPPDKLDVIFRPFEQVDTSLSRRFGGTGLGLAIASQIVTRMGGHIWVESEVGRGSTFNFTVSLTEAMEMPPHLAVVRDTPSPTRATVVTAVRPMNVLVADDVVPNQVVAQGLLQKRGHSVTLAASGREVLEQLERHAFDLLLLDIQMPEMDGFRTTELIRQREKTTGKHVPIIAMTAHAMKGDRERCLNGGMDGYVSKPLQWPDVETEIDRLGIPTLPAPGRGALWEQLMARGDGDKNFVRNLLRTFVEVSPQLVAEVSDAVNADDCDAWRTAIHKLKGACFNLLPDRDWHPLIRLEEMADKGMLMDAHEQVVAFNKEMNKLLQELTSFLGELEE